MRKRFGNDCVLCKTLPTLYSDIDIGFLGTRTVLGFYSVDATVVPVSITDKNTAGANASSNLNVDHGPLVNLFAILVPDDLGDWSPSDAAGKLNVLSSLQGQYLVWRPLDLRSNLRCKESKQIRNQYSQSGLRDILIVTC